MDNHIVKKSSGERFSSRRLSGVTVKDADNDGKNNQYCNRLGCSTRHNYLKGAQIFAQEKAKPVKPSLRPVIGKERIGSSSRTIATSSSYRRSFHEQQTPTSLRQSATMGKSSKQGGIEYLPSSRRQVFMEDLGSNGRQDDNEDSGSTSTSMESFESTVLEEISSDSTTSPMYYNLASSSKTNQLSTGTGRPSFGRQDAPSSSHIRRPTTAHRSFSHAAKPVSLGWGVGAGTQSSALKNLRCTSISDVLPSGCSSSGYNRDRAVDISRKRLPDGQSSSTRNKAINTVSGSSTAPRPAPSSSRLTIPERVVHQPISRRTREQPIARDSPISVRTRRTTAAESRTMPSLRGNDNILAEHIMAPQVQHPQFSIPEVTPESSARAFTMEMPLVLNGSSGRPGSSHRSSRNRSVHRSDDQGDLETFNGSFGGRDSYRRFNMEGVAEVLLALERIEQDEELSYEQLLILETSLLLGGLNFHDHHRDMRLDIDNMSYEELLALEDKMGSVSTALSEEQMSKCLDTSVYEPKVMLPETNIGDVDDVKCSICQEEYVVGDELGNLSCKHHYHMPCIQHWLQQKNWCPICKSSALSS